MTGEKNKLFCELEKGTSRREALDATTVKTGLLSHRMLIFQIPLLCLHSVRVHALSCMLGAHLARGRRSWSRWSTTPLPALSLWGSCAHFELLCGWKDKPTTCVVSTHTESPLTDHWWGNHSKYIILARTLTDTDALTFALMNNIWFLQSSHLLCFFFLSSYNSVRFDKMVRFILVSPNDFIFVYIYPYYFLKNNDSWILLLMLLVSVFSELIDYQRTTQHVLA